MADVDVKAICVKCLVAPEGVPGTEPQIYACPVCGARDEGTVILDEMKAHVAHVSQQYLEDAARTVSEKVPWMTFTPGSRPTLALKWISDLKPEDHLGQA